MKQTKPQPQTKAKAGDQAARPKTLGLALGGGAFRGLAHIGVLQVFKEQGIPIDVLVGTSMGSVVGALYASGMDPHFMQRLCEQLRDRDFLELRFNRMGLISGDRIQSMLRTLTGNKTFADTRMPFTALACDLGLSKLCALREGPLHEAVRASIAIPGVFAPHVWNGRLMVDGGVLERVSCLPARELGADYVVAVDVGYRGYPRESKPNMMNVIMQSLELMEWEILRERTAQADLWITPPLAHINPASIGQFDECVAIGRTAAEEAVPAIKAALNLP